MFLDCINLDQGGLRPCVQADVLRDLFISFLYLLQSTPSTDLLVFFQQKFKNKTKSNKKLFPSSDSENQKSQPNPGDPAVGNGNSAEDRDGIRFAYCGWMVAYKDLLSMCLYTFEYTHEFSQLTNKTFIHTVLSQPSFAASAEQKKNNSEFSDPSHNHNGGIGDSVDRDVSWSTSSSKRGMV